MNENLIFGYLLTKVFPGIQFLFLKFMQNIMGIHIFISLYGNKLMRIMEVMRNYFIPRNLYT